MLPLTIFLLLVATLFPVPVLASLFMKEDKTCDPMAANWLAYSGFRVQRLYAYSVYPGLPETRHALLLSHCAQGRVNYGPAVVPVGRHEDVAWGVNICGGAPDPGAIAPAPTTLMDRELKRKLQRLRRRRQRWTVKNPLYRTRAGTKVWTRWIASPQRQWVFRKMRKMNVKLLAEQHEALKSLYSDAPSKTKTKSSKHDYDVDAESDDEYANAAQLGNWFGKKKSKRQSVSILGRVRTWKKRNVLALTLRMEALMNSTIPVADGSRLMTGYGALDAVGAGGSQRSKNWRKKGSAGYKLNGYKDGGAAADASNPHKVQVADGSGGGSKWNDTAVGSPGFPDRGSSLVSPALSRLSSNPLDPYREPPPYCYRLVRRKKYAVRQVSVYMPNTLVGGLFMCPRYGRCTNNNAVPVMPLYSDNYEGQWLEAGPVQWFKAGAGSAEQARESFASAAGVVGTAGELTSRVWSLVFGEEEKKRAVAGARAHVGVKGRAQAALGLLANRMPTWLSLRRTVVQRVPFLATAAADGRRGRDSDGVAGVWPLWAHELEVDEAYEYDTLELELFNKAVTTAMNAMAWGVKKVDLTWDTMFEKKEEEEDGNMTTLSVKKWPFTTVFSNNMLFRLRKLGMARKNVWALVKAMQAPFDELPVWHTAEKAKE